LNTFHRLNTEILNRKTYKKEGYICLSYRGVAAALLSSGSHAQDLVTSGRVLRL